MSDEQQQAAAPKAPGADIYERLAAPFDIVHRRPDGLDYITGEQCVSRLNDVLGFLSWSFRVVEDGIHAEADECWAHGELTVHVGDATVVRQQYGSQKVKRSRASGTPLDIGFDLKGAATDALKKCASLIGVALYLSEKDAPAERPVPSGPTPITRGQGAGTGTNGATPTYVAEGDGPLYCEECGEALTETRFKDGTNWAPTQLAVFGRRKHSKILCMPHYKEANQAKRRAEEMVQQAPF